MKAILRRAGLGLAIAAGFSVAALAGDTDRTRIDVRTKYDTVETVVVDALAPGEARSLSTAAGNPALVTRTDKGLRLELAGETFDVLLPAERMADADLPAGAKVIRIEKRSHDELADGADGQKAQHRTIVKKHEIKGESDGDDFEVELDMHEGDADLALAEARDPGPLAEGQRIRVIRELRREERQVAK